MASINILAFNMLTMLIEDMNDCANASNHSTKQHRDADLTNKWILKKRPGRVIKNLKLFKIQYFYGQKEHNFNIFIKINIYIYIKNMRNLKKSINVVWGDLTGMGAAHNLLNHRSIHRNQKKRSFLWKCYAFLQIFS
jgi:hypothetical protein